MTLAWWLAAEGRSPEQIDEMRERLDEADGPVRGPSRAARIEMLAAIAGGDIG